MSNFSQFFDASGAGGGGSGYNIYSGVVPPKFSAIGNLQNINTSDGITDNMLVPSQRDLVISVNVGSVGSGSGDITVADWQGNALVWEIKQSALDPAAVMTGFVYNPVLDKYYYAVQSSGITAQNGLFEINVATGSTTKLSDTPPEFMTIAGLSAAGQSGFSSHKASVAYVDSSGNYIWRSGNIMKKFNSSFTPVQTRSIVAGYNNTVNWYYTDDTKLRARFVQSYRGAVTAEATTVVGGRPLLVIERGKQRRMLDINAVDIFKARYRDDYNPSAVTTAQAQPYTALLNWQKSIAPMAPLMQNGPFFGSDIRLGLNTRNESVSMSDAFLVDRVDYDRWLNDIADAAGMRPAVESIYGAWVNV